MEQCREDLCIRDKVCDDRMLVGLMEGASAALPHICIESCQPEEVGTCTSTDTDRCRHLTGYALHGREEFLIIFRGYVGRLSGNCTLIDLYFEENFNLIFYLNYCHFTF